MMQHKKNGSLTDVTTQVNFKPSSAMPSGSISRTANQLVMQLIQVIENKEHMITTVTVPLPSSSSVVTDFGIHKMRDQLDAFLKEFTADPAYIEPMVDAATQTEGTLSPASEATDSEENTIPVQNKIPDQVNSATVNVQREYFGVLHFLVTRPSLSARMKIALTDLDGISMKEFEKLRNNLANELTPLFVPSENSIPEPEIIDPDIKKYVYSERGTYCPGVLNLVVFRNGMGANLKVKIPSLQGITTNQYKNVRQNVRQFLVPFFEAAAAMDAGIEITRGATSNNTEEAMKKAIEELKHSGILEPEVEFDPSIPSTSTGITKSQEVPKAKSFGREKDAKQVESHKKSKVIYVTPFTV
ncbi:unnamed protein product [Caenorhabditis bovis]|uniref:Uncharacterized protein n=1 Tax=Caenorhabditis bovis TaxID=2654633 RepID=A0A8S1F6L8_9PELO|nr:unnamed protein product [Caenorhabditis bovis]